MKFMQIKPQKARGTFRESLWTDPAWSAENKFDGDRRIAQFCGGFVPRFTGTRESVDGTGYVEKTENLPQFGHHKGLTGTVLDGEIVAPWAAKLPGGESKWVTSIMGSSPERAVALQRERGWLEYHVFDCLWFKGEDVRNKPLSMRRILRDDAVQAWANPYAHIVGAALTETRKRAEWGRAREGLVFKHRDHLYGDERLWVKLKREATADVVVMGFKPGRGKYKNMAGAIVFGQYVGTYVGQSHPTEMGSARGFTDAQMRALRPKDLGRVFRIKHNGREPTGAFRHPRFDGWRDDKSPKDCVYDPEET